MKATRPISERDLTTRASGDIGRRFLFLVYVLAGPGGLVALGAGVARHHPGWIAAGGVALGISATLHFTRRRWGAPALAADLQTTFKPRRVPKE